MERDKLNRTQFVHFCTHIHASAHKGLRVKKKKKGVPPICCQGVVSPYQNISYNIKNVPLSVSANQRSR